MRLGWAAVAAATGIVAAATAVARAEAPRRPITDVVVPGDRPLQPGPPLEPRHRILFLNRNGGGYMGCEPTERGINFTFSEQFGNDVRTTCEVIAQESGHELGMPEHRYLCQDVMSYLYCGNKTFANAEAMCGEFSETFCTCTGSTVNPYEWLLAALGPA